MMPQPAARTKLSGPRVKYPATNVACIDRNVDRQHEPPSAKLVQQRLAPGRTPSFADPSFADLRNKPDLMRLRCVRPHNSDADRHISEYL
jgi:hypothetical protein